MDFLDFFSGGGFSSSDSIFSPLIARSMCRIAFDNNLIKFVILCVNIQLNVCLSDSRILLRFDLKLKANILNLSLFFAGRLFFSWFVSF